MSGCTLRRGLFGFLLGMTSLTVHAADGGVTYPSSGEISAFFVPTRISARVAERWLEKGLELTGEDTNGNVPLLLIFAKNSRVGSSDPDSAYSRLIAQASYEEFFVHLLVKESKSGNIYGYMPRLLLNNHGAVFGGMLYGLRKKFARVHLHFGPVSSTYGIDARKPGNGFTPALEARFQHSHQLVTSQTDAGLRNLMRFLNHRWITRKGPRGLFWSHFKWGIDEVSIAERISASIHSSQPILEGWPLGAGVFGAELSGYFIQSKWAFSWRYPIP